VLRSARSRREPAHGRLRPAGAGHALTHEDQEGGGGPTSGWRRFIPTFRSGALAAVIVAFMLGGLVVAIAG
jgi:predicted cobalt transporter CbtA